MTMNNLSVAILAALTITEEEAIANRANHFLAPSVQPEAINTDTPDGGASPELGCCYELATDGDPFSTGRNLDEGCKASAPEKPQSPTYVSTLTKDQVQFLTSLAETSAWSNPDCQCNTYSLGMMLYFVAPPLNETQDKTIYNQFFSTPFSSNWNHLQLDMSQEIGDVSLGEVHAPRRCSWTRDSLGNNTSSRSYIATSEAQDNIPKDFACVHHLQQNGEVEKPQQWKIQHADMPGDQILESLADVIGEDLVVEGLEDDAYSLNSAMFDPPEERNETDNASFPEKKSLQIGSMNSVSDDQLNDCVITAATFAKNYQTTLSTNSQGTIPCFVATESNILMNGMKTEPKKKKSPSDIDQKKTPQPKRARPFSVSKNPKRRKYAIDKLEFNANHCYDGGKTETQGNHNVINLKDFTCKSR